MPSGYAVAIVIGVYPFLISWFFNRCLLGTEKKGMEGLDKDIELLKKLKPPLSVPDLKARKDAPHPRVLAAIDDFASRRKNGLGPVDELISQITAKHTASVPRRAWIEMGLWLAGVLVVTLGLGVWPLLTGGISPLRVMSVLWVTREQARESAQILLTGGAITLLSGLIALAWVPLAWRPVRARFGMLLEEAARKLQGAAQT